MQLTDRPWIWKLALAIGAVAIVVMLTRGPSRPTRVTSTGSQNASADRGIYLRSVAATLNDLAGSLDLELQPAQPILTASTSADGNEVRAVIIENPDNPDGVYNFLRAVDGNANFATLEVQPGDAIRLYVYMQEEQAEGEAAGGGFEQRQTIPLRVRRLDTRDPENSLVIEEHLPGPMNEPQRIEIWRYSSKRMDAIQSALDRYARLRRPPSGWEPSPDVGALQQIVERANQWVRSQPAESGKWRPTPLLADAADEIRVPTGPSGDRATKVIADLTSEINQRDGLFAEWEGRLMAQAVWCRDIAKWARGSATTDEDVAAALFDWTVRNVQLDLPGAAVTIHHPWQALLYGHGTAAHRAWVFVELCRQQQIDAALIRPKADTAPSSTDDAPLLVGVCIGSDMQLFDPQLGLPIPGAGDRPATLAEAAADDSRLRQLDVEGEYVYGVTAAQLSEVEAQVVASPLQLARRSAMIEGALTGEDFVKLAVNIEPLVERLSQQPQIKQVKLWNGPVQAIADEHTIEIEARRQAAAEFAPFAERPLLWQARALHFQGNKGVRAEERNDPLAEAREGHQEALVLYQNRGVRPSDTALAKQEAAKRAAYAAAKAAASNWLGLLCYDLGNYKLAEFWLADQTLDRDSEGRWAPGARYNLARTRAALGNIQGAVELLRSDPEEAPQRHGNLVLARQLEEELATEPSSAG